MLTVSQAQHRTIQGQVHLDRAQVNPSKAAVSLAAQRNQQQASLVAQRRSLNRAIPSLVLLQPRASHNRLVDSLAEMQEGLPPRQMVAVECLGQALGIQRVVEEHLAQPHNNHSLSRAEVSLVRVRNNHNRSRVEVSLAAL